MDIKLSEQNDKHVYVLCLKCIYCVSVYHLANISFLYFAVSTRRCKKVRSNECMIDLRLTISRRSKATQNLEMMAEQTK